MSYRKKVIIALVLISVARFIYIIYTPFDLSPDEAHYWDWSRRLALSYYSKGPFVAYVIAFFTAIFGNTEPGVRAGAVVFSALASYMLYLLGKRLSGSERTGFHAALLPAVIPLFSIGSILMTTDVLFVFFWTAAALAFTRATRDGGPWWYVTGFAIGAGFLAKYTMVLIYPVILLTLLSTEELRAKLKDASPYGALALSAVTASPVFIWNAMHGWVTIRHTMGQAHMGNASWSLAEPFAFVLSQAALVSPFIFILLAYGVIRCAGEGFKLKKPVHIYAFFASAFVFLFFFLKGFHGKVQGNWAVASYVTAIPAAMWALGAARGRVRTLVAGVAVAGVVTGALLTVLSYCPWLLEPLGAKKILWGPPFNRVTAWTELGRKVSQVKRTLGPKTFIMSDTYQITSELAFYTEGQPATYNVYTGSRRMNQYDLWPGFGSLRGYNAVYVKGGDAQAEPLVTGLFTRCEKEIFPVYYRGMLLKRFSIFRCFDFRGMNGRHPAAVRY